MKDIVWGAELFARAAHAAVKQQRKFTFLPYIMHPAAVVEIVRSVDHDPHMLAAAWLHDVVEDTGVTIQDVRGAFGDDVADLVGWLTDTSRPEDGNRAARRAIDRAHTALAPARAQTIKVADLIHNTSDILVNDPTFAVVYIREKEALMDVLTRADPRLIRRAMDQLEEYTGIIH